MILRKLPILIVLSYTFFGCAGLTNVPYQRRATTSAPIPSDISVDLDSNIYLPILDEENATAMLWKMNPGNEIKERVLTLPLSYPISSLPAQEMAILKHNICDNLEEICSNLNFDFSLDSLIMAPNRQNLAWMESVAWCPNTGCYGFQRIKLLDLKRFESEVLLEIPHHVDLLSVQRIDEIQWSPNSKLVGFAQSSSDDGWSRIRVTDSETNQIRDIGDGWAPFVWSPDGNHIACVIITPTDERVIKIMSNEGDPLIYFKGGWNLIEDIDWSPDGKNLIITAQPNDQMDIFPRYGLFIGDLATGNLSNILSNETLSYTQPKWDPSGSKIGVNTQSVSSTLVSGLLVFEFGTGKTVSNLELERPTPQWLWSAKGDKILIRSGSPWNPLIKQGLVIYDWQNSQIEQLHFPLQIERALIDGKSSLGLPTW
jgi:Tol biopolymer transport system component